MEHQSLNSTTVFGEPPKDTLHRYACPALAFSAAAAANGGFR
jgi:hypothetical protein